MGSERERTITWSSSIRPIHCNDTRPRDKRSLSRLSESNFVREEKVEKKYWRTPGWDLTAGNRDLGCLNRFFLINQAVLVGVSVTIKQKIDPKVFCFFVPRDTRPVFDLAEFTQSFCCVLWFSWEHENRFVAKWSEKRPLPQKTGWKTGHQELSEHNRETNSRRISIENYHFFTVQKLA